MGYSISSIDNSGGLADEFESYEETIQIACELSVAKQCGLMIRRDDKTPIAIAIGGFAYRLKYIPRVDDKCQLLWGAVFGCGTLERVYDVGTPVKVVRVASNSIVRVIHESEPENDFPVVPEEIAPL